MFKKDRNGRWRRPDGRFVSAATVAAAQEEDADTVPQSPMELLPLELLLRILGHVQEGWLLLDVVPLVCRRWRDAARDPEAWASVAVHCCDMDAPRVLLKAPALHTLEIRGHAHPSLHQDNLHSALRRSDSYAPQTLRLTRHRSGLPVGYPHDVSQFLLRKASTPRLRVLSTPLMNEKHIAWLPRGVPSMLEAIRKQPRLTQLHLHLGTWAHSNDQEPQHTTFAYAGELAGCLGELQVLSVLALWMLNESSPGLPEQLLNDLLASSELRALHLDQGPSLSPSLVRRLAGGLPRLDYLRLRLHFGLDGEDVLGAVRLVMAQCERAASLSVLTVVVCRGFSGELEAQHGELVEAFRQRRPGVMFRLVLCHTAFQGWNL